MEAQTQNTAPPLPDTAAAPDPLTKLKEYKGLLEAITDETARKQAEGTFGHSVSTMMYIGKDLQSYPDTMKKISFGSNFGFNAGQSVHLLAIDPKTKEPGLRVEGRKFLLAQQGFSWKPREHSKTVCTLAFYLKGEKFLDDNGNQVVISLTMNDAKEAGWAGKGGAYDNWAKLPESMLHAAVIRRFCQWHVPALLDNEWGNVQEDEPKVKAKDENLIASVKTAAVRITAETQGK